MNITWTFIYQKIPASSKTYKTSLIRNNNITQTKLSLIHTTFIKHNNNSEPSHKEGRRRTDSEPGSCTTTTRNRTHEGRKGSRLLSLCFLFDVFIFTTSILDLVRSPHPFSKIISEMKQGRWEEEIGPKKFKNKIVWVFRRGGSAAGNRPAAASDFHLFFFSDLLT